MRPRQTGGRGHRCRHTAAGGHAAAFTVDVADEQSVNDAVEAVASELSPPSVVVNNAGITRDNLLFKMTAQDWDSVLGVHLRSTFLVTRAAQTPMTRQGWGRIVNISSMSALGNRGQANCSAAKAGIQGFTKAVAIEFGKFGITATAIAPGFIATDMTAATAQRMGMTYEELQRISADQTAVKRVGVPADIAHAVAFLVSDGAGYFTGQTLYVTGAP
jgi:3-oxoacyl-[acyl-carrier protein] reductase